MKATTVQLAEAIFHGLAVLVALTVAVGGWIYESRQRRQDVKERRIEAKRRVYADTVAAIERLLAGDGTQPTFYSMICQLALIASEPVMSAAWHLHKSADEHVKKRMKGGKLLVEVHPEAQAAVDRLVAAMRSDLGDSLLADSLGPAAASEAAASRD